MRNLIKNIIDLTEKETEKGIAEHGEFVDKHQAYAVLLEEYEETCIEMKTAYELKSAVWEKVKNDENAKAGLIALSHAMILTAAEAVQTAAMCFKFIKMLDKEVEHE